MAQRRRFLQVLAGSMLAAGMGCSGSGSAEGDGGGTGRDGGGPEAGRDGGGSGTDDAASPDDAAATVDASAPDGGSEDAARPGDGGTDAGPACTPRGLDVGLPSAYATPGIHLVAGRTVLIGRDAGGLFAMTSLCTHQQCDLGSFGVVGPAGIRCGCHGSEYDVVGNPTRGPAATPLRHYRLWLECDGHLRVDVSMVVAQDQRLQA